METEIKQLIEHIELQNTPFTITGNQESGYFLRIGKYRLTNKITTEEMKINFEGPNWENTPESQKYLIAEWFEEYLIVNSWIITTNLIAAMLELNQELKSQIKTN